jgi:type VI secretion system FHA domain protein
MTLTLTVRNAEALGEGAPAPFEVKGDMAVVGRSRNCDWPLPDPGNAISSRHCEIRRDGDAWLIKDISTNGTFLNDAAERLAAEHRIAEGDLIRIGHYEVVASFGEAKTVFAPTAEAPPHPIPPAAVVAEANAQAEAAIRVLQDEAQQSTADAAAARADLAQIVADAAAAPDQVTVMWDSLADINKVDWARGGFGVKDAAPLVTDLATVDGLVQQLIEAAQLGDTEVGRSPELIAKAGALLKRLVAGLLVMVEARARAKAQMGAETTGLRLDGNNPIKFARTPEQALAQLLNPPESGFMEAGRAVEDAFLDLHSHQVATLKAIPGALRATLDRFSPGSIRRRRGGDLGFLAKLLPAFRDAALWRHYEREFVAVKKESDEAFMAVFAKEFAKAYERQLRDGPDA